MIHKTTESRNPSTTYTLYVEPRMLTSITDGGAPLNKLAVDGVWGARTEAYITAF